MTNWTGEIEAASIEQIRQGSDGTIHVIDADAGGIVQGLKRVDENLNLRYSEAGDYYVVYFIDKNGDYGTPGEKQLVATYQELDGRIVRDVERLNWENRRPGYSFADELERMEAQAEKDYQHRQKEAIGESAGRLAHALRKDMNMTDYRAFIPRDIEG